MNKQASCISKENPYCELAQSYLDCIRGSSRNEAVRLILDAVNRGVDIQDIYMYVFQPVQYEMGRLWLANQISIAQEHYCTAVTQLIMSHLYPRIMTFEKNGLSMVACCVGGELHELGIRMVTDLLEMKGWDTYYLGANMPEKEVVRSVKDQNVHLLAVSATLTSNRPRVEAIIKEVRQTPGLEGVKIMVGGHAFLQEPGGWEKIGADGSAMDAVQAVELAFSLCS
ncbi:cobalamin B12-binding domain protein [Desulfonatronospira thiodismutans ASO3-1]|uniref:Cobalamin B12-binding domain protein n=1 Tax=Desulfonatronospira thiodismutans ASO3-1 TaxID=555779 RepID=D6SSX9_9BACT|nr:MULTISPECIES: cobalamin-dependent protein [Desulfonatronospira]EFI33795.1 cobalamin B12-binding domain protein [Desulfonatronospira thiodismutans ASO3-1]